MIGTNLKRILKEKHITVKELSKLSGVSINTLYAIIKRTTFQARIYRGLSVEDALGKVGN